MPGSNLGPLLWLGGLDFISEDVCHSGIGVLMKMLTVKSHRDG